MLLDDLEFDTKSDRENSNEGFGESFQADQKPRKKEARKMAQQIIKEMGVTEAPINLRDVITHIQKEINLNVIGDKLTKNISGLIVKQTELEEEHFTIGFNINEPWCRRRFTIGHEIGHLKFGSLCNKNTESQDPLEKECHVFAAELLMPKSILKKDFAEIQSIPELAKKYLVSEQALCIKLGDDGLLKL